ncbi:MAG: cysteine desulfurase [Cyclobacteriaceae bacterium]|nr:cysteine desulfurase [Cyclobacteriaceae bacterium]
MKKPVYLDYNATTPIDPEVAGEMIPYIRERYGNPSSSYSIGRRNKEAVDLARNQVAALINARPDEIIFTSGGTESNNHAIRGSAMANRDKGKHIITSSTEHPAVTEVCRYLASLGWEITWIPVDAYGKVDPVDVEDAIQPDTVLITIMHANNEVGTIQPIREIAAISRKHDIVFHTDAAQSVGKIETDVAALGVDLLSIAGHKLYAPKGIGALYVKRGIPIEKLMYGAGQEMGWRPGTENVIHIAGLGKACEIAKRDFHKNVETMFAVRERLWKSLKNKLGGRVHLNTGTAGKLPNTLSVSFKGIEAHALVASLGEEVCISAGSACHADSVKISSVLKAMNMDPAAARGTVRISTGKFSTPEEVDHALDIIINTVTKLS